MLKVMYDHVHIKIRYAYILTNLNCWMCLPNQSQQVADLVSKKHSWIEDPMCAPPSLMSPYDLDHPPTHDAQYLAVAMLHMKTFVERPGRGTEWSPLVFGGTKIEHSSSKAGTSPLRCRRPRSSLRYPCFDGFRAECCPHMWNKKRHSTNQTRTDSRVHERTTMIQSGLGWTRDPISLRGWL